jgi:hypothetical protein
VLVLPAVGISLSTGSASSQFGELLPVGVYELIHTCIVCLFYNEPSSVLVMTRVD